MLGTLFLVIAGWYRSKIAALAVIAISFLVQVAWVMPRVAQNKQLLGLTASDPMITAVFVALELILFGLIFYFAGSGLRWLWDRRKRRNHSLPDAGTTGD